MTHTRDATDEHNPIPPSLSTVVNDNTQSAIAANEPQSMSHVSSDLSTDSPVPNWRSQSLRQVHGRGLNSQSDIYSLPADEEEVGRLDKLQKLFYYLGPSNHYYGLSDAVEEALAPTAKKTRTVLDLGCGTATWTVQCATDFPHADVLGVDLAPNYSKTPPPNCRFEVLDINNGLEQFFGDTFDLIHARFINTGIKDYKRLLDQVAQCLRPGGLTIFVEFEYCVWSEDKHLLVTPNFYTPLPSHNITPANTRTEEMIENGEKDPIRLVDWALPSYMAMLRKCAEAKGGDIAATRRLRAWLNNHDSYIPIETRDLWMPCGGWTPTIKDEWTTHPNFRPCGELCANHFAELCRSARPLLLSYYLEQEITEIEEKAIHEVTNATNSVYGPRRVAAAKKK